MTQESAEFNPVNPLDLDEDKQDIYFERLDEAQYIEGNPASVQDYVGSKDLLRLVRDQVIGVGVIIRFWQTNLPEFNSLTRYGLIPRGFNGDRSRIIAPPFQRLDYGPMGRPYHWNIEGYELITNAEVDEIVNPS